MMDGRSLFPEGHHPVDMHLTPDVSRHARRLSRSEHDVKYYFIDFGMSSYFKEGEPPYVLGAKGADRDAPELSDEHPYNPFMLDVFILGHVYEVQFLQVSGQAVMSRFLTTYTPFRFTSVWIFYSHSSPQ